MTTMLWMKDPVTSKRSNFHLIKEDQLISFGKLIQKNQDDKFVVIGKEYLYIINKGNEAINEVTQLHNANSRLALVTDKDNSIKLTVAHEKANSEFTTNVTLNFILENPSHSELSELEAREQQLRIKYPQQTNLTQKNNIITLSRTIHLEGIIVPTHQNDKKVEKTLMSQNYKVQIGYQNAKKKLNFENLAGNIVQTPFALAADALIIPFAIITVMIGK